MTKKLDSDSYQNNLNKYSYYEKLQFKVNINAPVNKIYDFMLEISSKSTYEQWTSLFNPTSSYEGIWDKGNFSHERPHNISFGLTRIFK